MKPVSTIGLILLSLAFGLRAEAQTYATTTFAGQSGIG